MFSCMFMQLPSDSTAGGEVVDQAIIGNCLAKYRHDMHFKLLKFCLISRVPYFFLPVHVSKILDSRFEERP